MATQAKQKKSIRRAEPLRSVDERLANLRACLQELQERYKVRNLWIFGSFVRGEARKSSDVDLLVEFNRAPSLFEFVRLERLISEKLGIEVDLVMKSALKPSIGTRILQDIIAV